MIKLKHLIIENIQEAKRLDLNNVDDAAEYLIRKTWKVMPKEDRYSEYQLFLWLDNERPLSEQMEAFAKKFFPDEKFPSDKFSDVISNKLEELERAKYDRMSKKINTGDPLFLLKQVVIRKTYEGAKQALVRTSLAAWGYKGGKIKDAEAENIFNRLYKNAMGETVYDENRANTYGKLSDLKKIAVTGDGKDYMDEYSINLFIDHYAGYNSDKFTDKVKIYRGVNNPTVSIRPGDYVTFDKNYARYYMRGKFGSVVSDIINSKDLYVSRIEPGNSELVYWPEGHKIKKYEGHIPTFKEFWAEVNSY